MCKRQPLFELFLQDELRNKHLENRKKNRPPQSPASDGPDSFFNYSELFLFFSFSLLFSARNYAVKSI